MDYQKSSRVHWVLGGKYDNNYCKPPLWALVWKGISVLCILQVHLMCCNSKDPTKTLQTTTLGVLQRIFMGTRVHYIQVSAWNALKGGHHFVSCQLDEWLLNLLINDQETVETVAHAAFKSWNPHLTPGCQFMETSATFIVIILSLCYLFSWCPKPTLFTH